MMYKRNIYWSMYRKRLFFLLLLFMIFIVTITLIFTQANNDDISLMEIKENHNFQNEENSLEKQQYVIHNPEYYGGNDDDDDGVNPNRPDAVSKTELKFMLKCKNRELVMETLQHGDYWVLQNLIRGRRTMKMECWQSITYTTVADFTYLEHLEILVKRWNGPISLALFAPGYDFSDAMAAIQYMRNCLSVSHLIRDYVTFHLYFAFADMPYDDVPRSEEEALNWPYDCTEMFDFSKFVNRTNLYMERANLTFPINVGRNIAREAANTHFILASDIELYPSLDFIDQFLHMAANNYNTVIGSDNPGIFSLPVFELEENASIPDTKKELMAMLRTGEAKPIYSEFEKRSYILPDQHTWVNARMPHNLEILITRKRYGTYAYWEPFFVSNNKEPIYDERLSLESGCSRRIQNYAMCLMHYDYHVLHPAFLVRTLYNEESYEEEEEEETFDSNGANEILENDSDSDQEEEGTLELNALNAILENEIVPNYKILYGEDESCKV